MSFLLDALPWVITFLIAVSVHESAHALTAYWLGDPTAQQAGRITLNPLKHIDPFGLLFLLFVHFGWARPVPVQAENFRHPYWYMALTAAAGPLSNLILAFLSWNILAVLAQSLGTPQQIIIDFLVIFFQINILLAAFNLLPLFPLDGEKILALLIPKGFRAQYHAFAEYGPLILFGLIGVQFAFGINIFGHILFPLANWLGTAIQALAIFS